MLPTSVATGILRGLVVRVLSADTARCLTTTATAFQQQTKGKGSPAKTAAPRPPPPPSTPPTAAGPSKSNDVILDAFRRQMQEFRGMSAGLQKIPVPWNLDDKGVQKYMDDVEGLRKKIGAPSWPEHAKAEMQYLFDSVGQNWRKFIKVALTSGPVDDSLKPVIAEMEKTIDEIEAKTGKPLDHANPEGLKMWHAKAKDFKAMIDWKDDGSAVKEMTFAHYKASLADMKESLMQQMQNLMRNLGLTDADYKIDFEKIQNRIMSKAKKD